MASGAFSRYNKNLSAGAVVVAQMEEQSLPIPEVRSLNQVIGKK